MHATMKRINFQRNLINFFYFFLVKMLIGKLHRGRITFPSQWDPEGDASVPLVPLDAKISSYFFTIY